MAYYLDIVPSNPRNDVRPIWTEDTLLQAISEATAILTVIKDYRGADSTAARVEAMRLLKGFEPICLEMIMEEISEQLKYLKDNRL